MFGNAIPRQQGAVIVTVALLLLFLMGFMGIALDFGRLFVVKSELQTAMDSCALAAAQELDRQGNALIRARSAGRTAGNMNGVDLQSANWRGMGQIVDGDITFKDAAYVETIDPAVARYAQCEHTQSGIQMWLMQAMSAFSGDAATYPSTRNVLARAVATRASAQTTCPVPVALKPKAGEVAPNYGFAVGEWVTLIMAQDAAVGGEIGWANLDGSNSAVQTENEMEGSCGTEVGDELGTPGVQSSIAEVWNYRFGIYRNKPEADPSIHRPDFTGYAYTPKNWPAQSNAYGDFLNKRSSYASCADTSRDITTCRSITGLSLHSFSELAEPGMVMGGHRQYGSNRRLVTVPVIDGAKKVIDYACMLMLQPLNVGNGAKTPDNVQLEFRGNAGAPNSPCTTNGLPGGSAGPLVAVLVE